MNNTLDYEKLLKVAEEGASKKNWTEMALASCDVSKLLTKFADHSKPEDLARKIEDETYLQNALRELKLAKALDLMDHMAYAYKHSMKAFRTIESLVKLRQDQDAVTHKQYINILAPFYYKVGDFLATFIELNTDEFGNIKPLP